MNTRLSSTIFSLFGAALVTVSMLAGIDSLATHQPAPAPLAQGAAGGANG